MSFDDRPKLPSTATNKQATARSSLWLAGLLGLTQPSCGAAAGAELTCGTGNKLVLGYQATTDVGERVDTLTVENGYRYLFVDESCNYWVLPGRQSVELGRHGTLTSEQLARLNRDLMTRGWIAMRDAKPVPFAGADDGQPQYLWRDETVVKCSSGCPEVVSSAISVTESLVSELFDSGELLSEEAPLRWRIYQDSYTVAIAPVGNWEGMSSLEELAEVAALPMPVGNAPLVEGKDAGLVRRDFAELLVNYAGQPFSLFYMENELRYLVQVRDALPFEDERGLVRPPGIDWGVE